MTFLTLGIIQLTLVQQARIMTEYAAFCAARAGVVFNGDPDAMKQAALVALAPTIGRSESLAALQNTLTVGIGVEKTQRANAAVPIVQIETLRPLKSDIQTWGTPTKSNELDFDDIRPGAAAVNILQIRVHYYFNMKVPFINEMLQSIFFAQKAVADGSLLAALNRNWKSNMLYSNQTSAIAQAQNGFSRGGGVWNTTDNMLVPAYNALVAAAQETPGHYYFPLAATYSMRMQSNFYVANAGRVIN
jgi:hypothetical protein